MKATLIFVFLTLFSFLEAQAQSKNVPFGTARLNSLSSKKVATYTLTSEISSKVFNVKMGIPVSKPNWVLFKNGTYLVFKRQEQKKILINSAELLLSRVTADTKITVTKSPLTKGWVARTETGVYHYISPSTLGNATDLKSIEKMARKGMERDQQSPVVIHINTPKNTAMKMAVNHTTVVVNDYDEAITFFKDNLNFLTIKDVKIDPQTRLVMMCPLGDQKTAIVLQKAKDDTERKNIGSQFGVRSFLSLYTKEFDSDYRTLLLKGIEITKPATQFAYGKVASFKDLYGNQWDLIEPK